MYEATGRNLIPRATYLAAASPIKTGFQTVQDARGALLVLYVETVTSGSITELNVYLAVPPRAKVLPAVTEEFKVYAFAALGINAAGVYVFAISPDGVVDMTTTGEKIGPFPPHFDVEILLAGGSSIKCQLDANWLY